MPVTNEGRTISQVVVNQGAAGATDLVTAPGAGQRIHVTHIFLVLDAAGTIKFTEGTGPTDLTGVMPIALNGQLNLVADSPYPILSTQTAAAKLSITTATGKAQGWIRYYVE